MAELTYSRPAGAPGTREQREERFAVPSAGPAVTASHFTIRTPVPEEQESAGGLV